jgi:hypothetical protein
MNQRCGSRSSALAKQVTSNLSPTKKEEKSRELVAQVCNQSYSRGRDQEDHGLKPAWANSLRPYLVKRITKRAGGVVQGVGPEFKLQNCGKKKKKRKKGNFQPHPDGH